MIGSSVERSGSVLSAIGDQGKAAKKAQVRAQTRHAAAATAKSARKAKVRAQTRHAAAATAKSARNASPDKKAAKGDKKVRDGSKAAKVLDLLKQPGGITAKELMKVTGWQSHSVRGFLSGTVRKKMGLEVSSIKGGDGERSYSVKA